MAISLTNIEEIYGEEVLENLKDEYNYEQFEKNILYLKKKNIESIDEIIERCFLIFLTEHQEFKEKVDIMIKELGENYIDILENDISCWEDLM